MTLKAKVQSMQTRMAELHRGCERDDQKRHCYSLLHDAIAFTGNRIHDLEDGSLVGFIELAAAVVIRPDANLLYVRKKLVELGFNTAPAN